MKKFYLLLFLTLLAVQPAHATRLYKWVDEYGNVTYKDTPPTDDSIKYKEKNINGGNSTSGDAADEAAEKFPVVMYSTPSCTPCATARAYLQSRGVPFQDKNVEGNGQLQQELKKKAGEISVPTIFVGSKVMKGYVQSVLAGELDSAGYPKVGEAESSTQQGDQQSQGDETGQPGKAGESEDDKVFKDLDSGK